MVNSREQGPAPPSITGTWLETGAVLDWAGGGSEFECSCAGQSEATRRQVRTGSILFIRI